MIPTVTARLLLRRPGSVATGRSGAEICTRAKQKNLRPDAIQAIAKQGWAGRRISQDSASGS